MTVAGVAEAVRPARGADRRARILVAGNPNAGKSTLFNALTGGSSHVSNFPGTSVSTTEGTLRLPGGREADLVDLPGTYSLAAASPEEAVAIAAILGAGGRPAPDLVLVVADGPRLLRSLYLALQVLELGIPTVLAVNLLDEARAEGLDLRLDAVSEALGVPVVGTVARSREGLEALVRTLDAAIDGHPPKPAHGWSASLDGHVAEVARALPALGAAGDAPESERRSALARWLLLSADAEGRVPGFEASAPAVLAARDRARAEGRDLEAELVATRYAWIDARGPSFLGRSATSSGPSPTERIDRVLLHPVVGPVVFLAVMAIAFTALFSWADPLIGLIESAFGWVGGGVAAAFDALASAWPGAAGAVEIARDLTVDGLIGGVGGVLVFLPQIAMLFLLLAFLEDCGYLARAAHLMDRVLRAAGLPGRAFVPMLSGYACAVPAILATRTMPRFRDRLLTMLVIPLTSCSARLPVYTLMIAALFPTVVAGFLPVRPLVLLGMYVFSTAMAVAASVVLGRTLLHQREEAVLLELPPYRLPDPRVVFGVVVSRCTDFVREAGGIILVATVVIWAALYFPRYSAEDLVGADAVAAAQAAGPDAVAALDEQVASLALERSVAGRLGHAIEPVIAPLGFDWRIGIGILGAFAAREVFVATMGVVYGIGDEVDEQDAGLRERLRTDVRADGTPTYTPLVAVSLMVFFALALQCLSTMAVLRKESGGWRWPTAVFVWNGALAWSFAFVVYQGGRWLGLQ